MPLLPASRASALHYNRGAGCDGWHLVKQEKLSVIEERMPPGSSETIHCRRDARQFFYILAGEAVMEAPDESIVPARAEGLRIRPGTRTGSGIHRTGRLNSCLFRIRQATATASNATHRTNSAGRFRGA